MPRSTTGLAVEKNGGDLFTFWSLFAQAHTENGHKFAWQLISSLFSSRQVCDYTIDISHRVPAGTG